MDNDEQLVLAKIRTLLALERKYLAEEKTALSEFRTGLALFLIVPPATGLIIYITSVFLIEMQILASLPIFVFFIALIIIGGWMIFCSRSALKKIQRKKKLLKNYQVS